MSSSGATVFAGRYRVIGRLGVGGTAAVFLARDELLGREVAVKRLHGAEVTAQTAQRLRREARIMASLRHPNLVEVYDMLMDEDDLLLVMEYVPGETLGDVLASAPLGWERTVALLEPVAAALDHVHGQGVVHRDLKPSNILVGPGAGEGGRPRACHCRRDHQDHSARHDPGHAGLYGARAGAGGTMHACGGRVCARDHRLPGAKRNTSARRHTVVAVVIQATRLPPPDVRERRPGTPAAAAEVLMRGMSARPEERQRSASQLLHELNAACGAGAGEYGGYLAKRRSPTFRSDTPG
jgi:hypothetical protein